MKKATEASRSKARSIKPVRRKSRASQPQGGAKGNLIIIGGREDKEGELRILKRVAESAAHGKLVVATIASKLTEEHWRDYSRIFRKLGVKHLEHLHIDSRKEALADGRLKMLEKAEAVFFTGGDQLRITSELGGTSVCDQIHEIYERGGTIAGTSAGASVMADTMLVSGSSDESHRIGGVLQMAPGLGFMSNVIIDQHFAERGRIGRLLGAVAQNPKFLGVGIDEDTSIILEGKNHFEVMGKGAVYVIDASQTTDTNISDETSECTMSIFDVKLHILSDGDLFDLRERRPEKRPSAKSKVA